MLTAYYAALTPKSKIAASELQNGQLGLERDKTSLLQPNVMSPLELKVLLYGVLSCSTWI